MELKDEAALFLHILEANLKAAGMPAVEALAKKVYGAVDKSFVDFAAQSSNPVVKLALPPLAKSLDGIVNPVLDKIDGQIGN